LDKTVWGHKKKTCPRGVKKSCFGPERVRKIPVFVQGVEKIPIVSEGVTENVLALLLFFNGIALSAIPLKSGKGTF